MAYEILSESYGRRLPKITAEADSTDDLATLGTNYAEGSTCVIGDKTYSLDKVQGWVEPGSGSGGALPAVTSEDNGDVLTVVEGAWDKAAPSGGDSQIEYLTYTVTPDPGGDFETWTLDKTYAELKAAYNTKAFRLLITWVYHDEISDYDTFNISDAYLSKLEDAHTELEFGNVPNMATFYDNNEYRFVESNGVLEYEYEY